MSLIYTRNGNSPAVGLLEKRKEEDRKVEQLWNF